MPVFLCFLRVAYAFVDFVICFFEKRKYKPQIGLLLYMIVSRSSTCVHNRADSPDRPVLREGRRHALRLFAHMPLAALLHQVAKLASIHSSTSNRRIHTISQKLYPLIISMYNIKQHHHFYIKKEKISVCLKVGCNCGFPLHSSCCSSP